MGQPGMPWGRECHTLQKQECDRGGITECELPTFLSCSGHWSRQRAQCGKDILAAQSLEMLKRCCLLMRTLIFLD